MPSEPVEDIEQDKERAAEYARTYVAAPICNSQGRPIAALSISGSVSHVTGSVVGQIARDLMEATRKVSGQLGFVETTRGKQLRYDD